MSRGTVAGLSLGLLTGFLLGLSASPVVGTVMAALTAILASVLGLAPELAKFTGTQDAMSRVIAFSLAAIVAVLIALPIRTYGVLSPDPHSMMSELQGAGFTRDEAAKIVAANRYSIASSGKGSSEALVASSGTTASALFSSTSEACTRLQQISGQPAERQLSELRRIGGDFAKVADRIAAKPPQAQVDLLAAFMTLNCG